VKVIVGLGNPGREYEHTRHNVGWWVVDHLADVWHFGAWRTDGSAAVASGRMGNRVVKLLKPLTYMNRSGVVLIPFARRPSWSAASDLLVILDDIALPIGTIRFRTRGSSGGHNGLKSIEESLDSRDYARLRIGIQPADPQQEVGDLAAFVLSPFGVRDRKTIAELLPRVTETVEQWVNG